MIAIRDGPGRDLRNQWGDEERCYGELAVHSLAPDSPSLGTGRQDLEGNF